MIQTSCSKCVFNITDNENSKCSLGYREIYEAKGKVSKNENNEYIIDTLCPGIRIQKKYIGQESLVFKEVEPKITALFIQYNESDWTTFNFQSAISQNVDEIIVVLKEKSIAPCYKLLTSLTKDTNTKFRVVNFINNIIKQDYIKYINTPYTLTFKTSIPDNFIENFRNDISRKLERYTFKMSGDTQIFSTYFLKYLETDEIYDAMLQYNGGEFVCIE